MDTKVLKDNETRQQQRRMANAIRALSMDAVQKANSGHPGLPLGMADAVTALFTQHLKFDAADPYWADRDRFILSAGHGSMLLYSLLYLCGYQDMTIDQIRNFRQLGSRTAGHPEYGYASGIEMTTGPLGQGIATAVGMALAEKKLAAEFGDKLVDHYTYVVAGDGCLMEGISHEAIDLAGHLGLSKLIVLFDDNGISIDGSTDITTSIDQLKRFEACGWDVSYVDGHDSSAVSTAISRARTTRQPSLIACKTIIGFGAPNKQGTAATHGAPLGEEEIAEVRKTLEWEYEAFEIPDDLLQSWRQAGSRAALQRRAWQDRLDATERNTRQRFNDMMDGVLPQSVAAEIDSLKSQFSESLPGLATRQSSEKVLDRLLQEMRSLLSGSADLSGSNGTRPAAATSITADDFSGNYLHYGVREHAMAAMMNGIALHGGYIPLSGTFLAFADYNRAAIRLGALMKKRVVHVMTHDSIGLGEDGPTHQPVEQVASLRAIPNLSVFRPADAVEVAEAWQCALGQPNTPSVLCLTRQAVPTLRSQHERENLTSRGAYVIREAAGKRQATILATGSEVSIAIDAAELLARIGVPVAVVSMPCWELFERQDEDYQKAVLGSGCRVAIEAGIRLGWDRWLGRRGGFVGMTGFGASGPASELYEHFNITAEAVRDEVRRLLQI